MLVILFACMYALCEALKSPGQLARMTMLQPGGRRWAAGVVGVLGLLGASPMSIEPVHNIKNVSKTAFEKISSKLAPEYTF